MSSNVGNINNSGTLGAGNQQQQQQPPLHTVILGNQVLRVQPIHHPVVATNRVKLQTASSPQATTETFEQQGIGMHLPTSSTNTGGPLISQVSRGEGGLFTVLLYYIVVVIGSLWSFVEFTE